MPACHQVVGRPDRLKAVVGPPLHRTVCLPNKYQEAYQDGVVRLSCQTHNTHRFPFFPPFNPKGRRKYTSRAVPWVAATKTPGRVSRSCRSHQLRNHLFSSSSKKEPLLLCSFCTRALGVLYVSGLSCHRLDEVEKKKEEDKAKRQHVREKRREWGRRSRCYRWRRIPAVGRATTAPHQSNIFIEAEAEGSEEEQASSSHKSQRLRHAPPSFLSSSTIIFQHLIKHHGDVEKCKTKQKLYKGVCRLS